MRGRSSARQFGTIAVPEGNRNALTSTCAERCCQVHVTLCANVTATWSVTTET
jgi:hypothetical protein